MKQFLIASVLIVVASAQAQMIAPPKELKALEPMIGTYTGTVKTPMGDMSVTMTSEWAEGGMFVKTTNAMKVGEIQYTETVYTCWDAKAKKYRAYGFQSMVPTPRIDSGSMEGNKLVMISEPWEMVGVSYTSRSTIIFHNADEMEFNVDFKMGDQWSPQGGGRLKRVKKGAWCASTGSAGAKNKP